MRFLGFYRIKDTLLSNREQAQGSAAADHQMLALYAAGRSDGDPGLLALLAEKSQELCWHQSVTGETNAAGLLEAALKNCRDYKGEDIMLVADSKSRNIRNVALCYDRKVPFLLQASLQSAVLKKHILDRAANLSMGNGCIKIECENNYCFGIKIGREFSWTRTADRQKQRSKIWLYLFFTPALQSKAMGRYYDKMKQLNDLLYRHKQAISQAISSHRKKPAEPRLPAELQKLIDEQVLTYNPDTDDFRLNPAESLPRQILESSMILLSSEDMDVEQAYRLYQEGNIIGDINLHTARLQPQDNCEALQFMALLAAEGLRQIRHNLEACNEGKSGTKQMVLQDNSVRQMLRMLDNTENPAESRRLMTALYKANGI